MSFIVSTSRLSYWTTTRPGIVARSSGAMSMSGAAVTSMPPEWIERWRGKPSMRAHSSSQRSQSERPATEPSCRPTSAGRSSATGASRATLELRSFVAATASRAAGPSLGVLAGPAAGGRALVARAAPVVLGIGALVDGAVERGHATDREVGGRAGVPPSLRGEQDARAGIDPPGELARLARRDLTGGPPGSSGRSSGSRPGRPRPRPAASGRRARG